MSVLIAGSQNWRRGIPASPSHCPAARATRTAAPMARRQAPRQGLSLHIYWPVPWVLARSDKSGSENRILSGCQTVHLCGVSGTEANRKLWLLSRSSVIRKRGACRWRLPHRAVTKSYIHLQPPGRNDSMKWQRAKRSVVARMGSRNRKRTLGKNCRNLNRVGTLVNYHLGS